MLFGEITTEGSMSEETRSRIHPLVAGASVAVIVASLVGVAAVTGHLPGSNAEKAEPQIAPQAVAPQAAPPKQQPAAKPAAKPATQVAAVAPPKHVCTDCAVVVDVKEVDVKGQGTGVGAVAGGVVGAVVGNQFGHGTGKTVMTVAGAAGGALAGNEIEKQARAKKQYDVGVRMSDGSVKTVTYETQPTWRSGDKVRLVNGKLEPQAR
jgi:outer membrane lipoprotein SlyB